MALIDRIKYDALSDEWLVWKYPKDDVRIGAQLIVNQSQEALFYKGGRALDLFGPGTHTLTTGNLPLLSSIINLPFGGETPFTAEVWFVNRHAKRDLRWGTPSPIPLIDPLYNLPVNVRAFGHWGVRVDNARTLVTQLVGTLSNLTSDRIDAYFMGEILQQLSDSLSKYFVERGVSIFHANARLNELSQVTADSVRAELGRFGLEVVNFNVERISMPDDDMRRFQEVLGKKMEIEQLSKTTPTAGYTTARTFDVLEKAAGAEGAVGGMIASGLGIGLGLGAGVPVGQQLGQSIAASPSKNDPSSDTTSVERLRKLKTLLDAALISEDEYQSKRKQILDSL